MASAADDKPEPLNADISQHTPPAMDVLLYYRSKVLAFEAERRQYLQRLADLEQSIGGSSSTNKPPPADSEEVRLDIVASCNTPLWFHLSDFKCCCIHATCRHKRY